MRTHTVNPQAKSCRVQIYGKLPMDQGVPPLTIKNLPESNTLKFHVPSGLSYLAFNHISILLNQAKQGHMSL